MSEFRIPCPNCSQAISTTHERAGESVRCPTCKNEFTLPQPAVSSGPPPLPIGAGVGRAGAAPRVTRVGGAVPPPLPTADAAASLHTETGELERQVLEGGRFVIFQYCFSVLVMTFKRSSGVMFLRGDEDGARHALNYSLISLMAGWWGIPWGPIWTLTTIISNARGGKDVTQAVLTHTLGPARAAQLIAQRRQPSPKGAGLKIFRWGLAGAALLLVLALIGLPAALIPGDRHLASRGQQAGEAQFKSANKQIDIYRGSAASGNSPKALAVAQYFSSKMKMLRGVLFEGGKPAAFSLSQHEFLTCCELQETQCVLIVHVPELRRFTDSAKASLGTLSWLTAQQALRTEQAGKTGMSLAVGLRGFALYDRVLIGTFVAESSESTNSLSETVTGLHPEERLFPWFDSAGASATSAQGQ